MTECSYEFSLYDWTPAVEGKTDRLPEQWSCPHQSLDSSENCAFHAEEVSRDTVLEAFQTELDATNVLIQMQAEHLCEAMRGVETASTTTTWATAGEVEDVVKDRFRDAIDRRDS